MFNKQDVAITHHGYKRTPEGKVGKYEESYGDTHERTYKVWHQGEHVATVEHHVTDEGFPNQIIYKQRSGGKKALTNYGAERTIDISDFGSMHHGAPDGEESQKMSSARQVASAVHAWHGSTTGQKWLGRKFKIGEESTQESTLNKIRRVLNLGESTSQTTYSDLFRYHDDMYHQKPRPGNQIHTKLHDPIHDRLRRRAAAQHYNVTGERLTSKDGKTYPPRELGEEKSTNAKEAAKHRAKAEEFRNMPASRFNQFGDKAGRVRERYIAHHSQRAHHYEKLAAAEIGESTEESPEYHSSEYHHRTCLAMDHANAGRTKWAGIHQKAAEKHAAAYHALTGKRIVDPMYIGSSPHIGSIAESSVPTRDEVVSANDYGFMHGAGLSKKSYLKHAKELYLHNPHDRHDEPHLHTAWNKGFASAGKEEHGLKMPVTTLNGMSEAFDPIKSFKRGASGWDTTFPRFNDLNDVSKGINYGRPKDTVRNTRTQSDEFLHSIHKRHVPNPDSPAGLQQRVARNELERRRKSGTLDPKYHIKQDNIKTKRVYGEATKPKGTNARIQAWHWMGAKKAMGAKYGFDHNVPVNQIPTSMEHNGKTVNPRRSVIWVAQQFANKDKAKKEK